MQKITDLTKEELIELIAQEREAAYVGWQPIESAPTDTTDVLVFTDTGDMYVSFYNGRYWDPSNIQSYDTTTDINGEPTHWMPLPTPPMEIK